MKTKTCDAIIVHAKPFFEKDKLIECISPTHGKIRCLAKSAQSNKSKLNGVLQPLHYVSLHLFVDHLQPLLNAMPFKHLCFRTQFKPLQTALYFTNIIRNSIQEHQINEELFTLLLTSLNYLNNKEDELWITQYFYKSFNYRRNRTYNE